MATIARSAQLLLLVIGFAIFTTDVASFEPRVTYLECVLVPASFLSSKVPSS